MINISFRLGVEDELSEIVIRKICRALPVMPTIVKCFRENGIGYVQRNISFFISAACAQRPYLVLVDLDRVDCAPNAIKKWNIPSSLNHFIFRIAVRETETWLLGDRNHFAEYFRIPKEKIPYNPESVEDPKEFIVNSVRRYGNVRLKRSVVPEQGSSAKIGKGFVSEMVKFAIEKWNVLEAKKCTDSLQRFINAVDSYITSCTS
jgi:hypothetical protein